MKEQLKKSEAEKVDKLKVVPWSPHTRRYFVNAAAQVVWGELQVTTRKIGNYFPKKEQAEAFAKHFHNWSVLYSRAIVLAEGCEPDWKDATQIKYWVRYEHDGNRFVTDENATWGIPGIVFLPSRGLARQLADWANANIKLDSSGLFQYIE